MSDVLDLWGGAGKELSGGLLLKGVVSLREGVLWSIGSCVCGCRVSALLKLLLMIPYLMVVASPLESPLRDGARDGGLLEDGRELAYVFASSVSVLLKRLIPASRPT
jgi:hypothetical protein